MGITVTTASYGRAALDRLAAVVSEAKGGDPMREVTIIAPDTITGIVARRFLARGIGGRPGIAGLDVTTLSRLADRIAAPALAPRRPATRPVVAAAWRDQLRSDPGVFAEVADHPTTIAALVRVSDELSEVSPEGLQTIGGASALGADLVRLHTGVRDRLRDAWYDSVDLLVASAEEVANTELVAIAGQVGRPVVLHLPQVLTPAERGLVSALAGICDVTVIVGVTGARRADRAVRDSLEQLDAQSESKASRSTVGGERPRIPTATRVLNASDSDDEVRCVVRDLLRDLRTTPASRVGVLYTAAAPYARLLHEQLAAAGIVVNGTGVRAVEERAVARTLLEVLRLADSDVARSDLFRAIAGAPMRDFTGARIPVSRWERTSRSAGVMRGDDWDERLATYVLDEETQSAGVTDIDEQWRVERHRTNAETARALQAFAVRLRAELARAGTMRRWDELTRWCLDLYAALIGEPDELRTLPLDEQHAAATVIATLHRLGSLDDVETAASLATLRDALETELAAALPRVGRFGEGVLVAPVAAAIGLDLDVTYVVGLSEDLFPGGMHEDALLPAHVRDLVPGELREFRDRLYAKYRHLLAAFASAPTVVASFPRGDLRRSTRRLPCRWLLPTLRALSDDDELAATAWEDADYSDGFLTSGSFAGELMATTHLATEQEWRTRAAAAGSLHDATVDDAVRMIDARAGSAFTRYDGNLAGVAGLPDYARGEAAVSPTSLESYAICPRAFFFERLLGVRPLEQPEDLQVMSARDIGTLMHDCMDALVQEFVDDLPGPGVPWSTLQRARFQEIAVERASAAESRGLTGHPRLWHPERLRILEDLVLMLDEDDRWRSELGASVVASELSFGLPGTRSRSPVTVAIPSGRVLMRGSADKVDVADGHLYVTDIKTGSRRRFADIVQDQDPLVGGTKLQLPVYAYAAREALGDSTATVTAGYWFVRRDHGRISLELTPALERTYAETLDILIRSIATGLFPGKAPEEPDFAWVQCPSCNPDGISHAEQRERWERQRHDPRLRELVGLIDAGALATEAVPDEAAR